MVGFGRWYLEVEEYIGNLVTEFDIIGKSVMIGLNAYVKK